MGAVCARKPAQVLPKSGKKISVSAQSPKNFRKPERGWKTQVIPDLVVTMDKKQFILDTKWKNLNRGNPSPDDLRQMYVYNELFDAEKSALIYPGEYKERHGLYYGREGSPSGRECSVISLDVDGDIRKWQENIGEIILNWLVRPG